jgi:hypothetical protein
MYINHYALKCYTITLCSTNFSYLAFTLRQDEQYAESFFNQLAAEERQYGYYQHDNATAHTTAKMMMLYMR